MRSPYSLSDLNQNAAASAVIHSAADAGSSSSPPLLPLTTFAYPRTGKRGVPQQFPRRLYEMLEVESSSSSSSTTTGTGGSGTATPLIAWSESGRAFRISDVRLFAALILPRYFRTSKFSSFQRNLNLYGFTKIRRGPETDMYAHPEFGRGRVDSLVKLRKLKASERPAGKAGSGSGGGGKKASSSRTKRAALESAMALSSSQLEPKQPQLLGETANADDARPLSSPRIVSPNPPPKQLRPAPLALPTLVRTSSGSSAWSSSSSTSTSSSSSSSLSAPTSQSQSQSQANASPAAPPPPQVAAALQGISIPSLLQQYQRQRMQEQQRMQVEQVQQYRNAAVLAAASAVAFPHPAPAPPPPTQTTTALPAVRKASPTLAAAAPAKAEFGMPPLAVPAAALPNDPPLPQAAAAEGDAGRLGLLALAVTSIAERS